MNLRESFHVPTQSFPTDVTAPAPTQLSGPIVEDSDAPSVTPQPNLGACDEDED
jgi:hypothetical protein